MFLKTLKQISLSIFGFIYSFTVITVLSILIKTGELVERLLEDVAPIVFLLLTDLLNGLLWGYALYYMGSVVINLMTGVPALLSVASPLALLSQLSILSPILLPTLLGLGVATALLFTAYIGIDLIRNLATGLWHSTMNFYDRGLIIGLLSPFKYHRAVFKYRDGDKDGLMDCLEETAIVTKIDIMQTAADHVSNSVTMMLRKFLPNTLATLVTEYAPTSIPETINSHLYTSYRQDITIAIETRICSLYGIFREGQQCSVILKKNRDYYNNNHDQEREAVFGDDPLEVMIRNVHAARFSPLV